MANFNWAYIDCSSSAASDGAAYGPTGSVQFMSASGNSTGSANFLFHSGAHKGYTANTLLLTGTMHINGALYANEYHVQNVTEASGSTFFGNSNADVHLRTGSMTVSLSSSTPILNLSLIHI